MKRWFVTLAGSVAAMVLAAGPGYGMWANGGTITTNGAYRIHTFTNSGTFTVGQSGNVEVLVVAAGGGGGGGVGGNQNYGGGGGGGAIYTSSFPVAAGDITVTVVAGGAGGYGNGAQGGNSVFSTLTATGGGYGGGVEQDGGNGGSGGGAGVNHVGGAGVLGQGYDGGPAGTYGDYGGGGGGAGAVGGAVGVSANGGAGITNSISGTATGYAGGGGAPLGTASDGGGAGNIGGGNGVAGTPNTGGGGGAGYAGTGGTGGSGIVIVRYIAPPTPPTYYVWKDNPSPASPFTNWATAATRIQDAVDLAIDGDTVYVTNGTYNTGGTNAPGYLLTNRVCVTRTITLRSFNNDPANTIIEGAADPTGDANGYGSNAVRGVFLTNGASLIGFTVTKGHTFLEGGHASEYDRCAGGVILYINCIVSNCVIATNMSYKYGGGVQLADGGTMNNCLIVGNTNLGGTCAGGVYIYNAGTLNNCMVKENYSENYAGGVLALNGGTLNNCQILNNRALLGIGGVQLDSGGTMKNCLVAGNRCLVWHSTAHYAGGIDVSGWWSATTTTVDNCTVVSNEVIGHGGGIAIRKGNNTTINNCIVWGNISTGDSYSNIYVEIGGGVLTGVVNNCNFGPVWTYDGVGNIGVDPQYADPSAGNYRLVPNSPCINAGTNLDWMTNGIDFDGRTRIQYGTVDMGAYEFIRSGTIYGFH